MQTNSFATSTSTMPSSSTLISGKTIQGTRVYSPAGDDLGFIEDVMIDAASGRTVYGVLQFGGFLGLGGDFHAIPYGKLTYDAERDGYVTDLTRAQLEAAPKQEESWRENRDWQKRSHEYYGVSPYWL